MARVRFPMLALLLIGMTSCRHIVSMQVIDNRPLPFMGNAKGGMHETRDGSVVLYCDGDVELRRISIYYHGLASWSRPTIGHYTVRYGKWHIAQGGKVILKTKAGTEPLEDMVARLKKKVEIYNKGPLPGGRP